MDEELVRRNSENKPNVTVIKNGEYYYAHLQIGNQGFNIMPPYQDGVDEDSEKCAQWVADMLKVAITRVQGHTEDCQDLSKIAKDYVAAEGGRCGYPIDCMCFPCRFARALEIIEEEFIDGN